MLSIHPLVENFFYYSFWRKLTLLRGTTERRMKSFQQIRQRQNKTCLSSTLLKVIVYKSFCNLSLLVKCLFKGRIAPLPHKANPYLQRTIFIYSFMKLNIYIVFLFTLNYIKLNKFRKVQEMPDCQTGPLAENLKYVSQNKPTVGLC